jgi:hypothetical protein
MHQYPLRLSITAEEQIRLIEQDQVIMYRPFAFPDGDGAVI